MTIDRAIFIGGCPRSGTTFLGNVLGLHTDCITTPESNFVLEVYNELAPLNEKAFERIVQRIESHWRFKTWRLRPNWSRAEKAANYGEMIFDLATQYGEKILEKSGRVWVDHNPTNVRDSMRMREIFPDAKYIHIVRDGRAVAKSIIPLNWGPSAIETAAYWWMGFISAGVAAEMNFGPNALRVRYEDLLRNMKEELQRICDFCEIAFEPQMLVEGRGFVLPNYSDDIHRLVGKAPDVKRIDDWKKSMSEDDIRAFEHLAGGLLDQLGYERVYPHGTPGPGKFYRAMTGVREALGIMRHTITYRPWKDY